MKMNKPCSCGSGKKYKRCCWRKAVDDRLEGIRKHEEDMKKRAEARARGETPPVSDGSMTSAAMMALLGYGFPPMRRRLR